MNRTNTNSSFSLRHPVAVVVLCALMMGSVACGQVRIEALTTVEGVRVNQLTGMGMITGLNGTGGTSPITRQFAQNLVQNFGIRATPTQRLLVAEDTRQRTDNVSVVTVIADLPIFARAGSKIDVSISAFDDASSLMGGTLITTPLMAVDGRVYAVASGPVSVGGFSFGGAAATVQKNHPTSGRIPNGATVELEVPMDVVRGGSFRLLLRHPSFQTAERVASAINARFPGVAFAEDAAAVSVIVPAEHCTNPVRFISDVRGIMVAPDMAARVVINERTGTIVIGQHVQLSAVAISHGNLSIVTAETPEVSQPNPLAEGGATAVVPRTELSVVEEERPVAVIGPTTTVGDLANALNMLGVTPRDLSAIFQQLHAGQALHAELVFH